MSSKKLSSLKQIGYISSLPKGADINHYETINIKQKGGKEVNLFRSLKDKKEYDDISNFSNSWEIFNSLL